MQDVMREIERTVKLRSLARELATLTGTPEPDAVLAALEDGVARLKGPVSLEERLGRALAVLSGDQVNHEGRVPARDVRDRALGYRREGI